MAFVGTLISYYFSSDVEMERGGGGMLVRERSKSRERREKMIRESRCRESSRKAIKEQGEKAIKAMQLSNIRKKHREL